MVLISTNDTVLQLIILENLLNSDYSNHLLTENLRFDYEILHSIIERLKLHFWKTLFYLE